MCKNCVKICAKICVKFCVKINVLAKKTALCYGNIFPVSINEFFPSLVLKKMSIGLDVCNSEKFIFEFNDDYTNLTYNKRVRDKSGKNLKITERLVCKEVESVSSSRNKQLLSESNGIFALS